MAEFFGRRSRKWWSLLGIIFVLAGAVWSIRPSHPRPFRLGLDLKGGVHLVYAADTSGLAGTDAESAMAGIRDVIERRVNALGVAEPIVQLTEVGGQWRLIVELAGVYDTQAAIEAIGKTPVLDFREVRGDSSATADQQAELDRRKAAAKRKAQEEILPQALAKDGDFTTLARVHSEDPGSKERGGDLGWFRRGTMVPEFEKAVFDQLKEGEVTKQLVESQFGWHIIQKTGEREVEEPATTAASQPTVRVPSITATTESGAPASIEVQPVTNETPPAAVLAKVREVRASHILIRKTTLRDLLGAEADWQRTELGGAHLKRAYLAFDQSSGQPVISLEFNDEGAALLEAISERNVQKPLGIFIDGMSPIDENEDGVIDAHDVYAPTIREKLSGGSAVISGNMTVPRAKQLASSLQAGALPIPITILSQTTVGPTLGQESIAASARAAIVGFVLVALFMLAYYRLPGVAAILALGAYAVLTLAVLKLLGTTLTLAGIAGFVMSMGMAVDANVLVFERMREELRRGRSLLDAIAEGFARAWAAIRDSNATTLLTCLILASFSSSVVKGFAITLGIGVLMSMISALVITRTTLYVLAGRGRASLRWYLAARPHDWAMRLGAHVIRRRRSWFVLSSIVVLASIAAIGVWRFNFGIDFTGGTLMEMRFSGERPVVAAVRERAVELGATRVQVQLAGEESVILRAAPMTDAVHAAIRDAYAGTASEDRYESIGPSIGRELAQRTAVGALLALVLVTVYIAWVFRKAGRAVSAWAYGGVALLAMAHDVLIPMGVFAVLGAFRGVEVGAPFVAAALTILGYSINDTIIVLDRVRENVARLHGKPFGELVAMSLGETFARSINTTLTTLLALLAVFFVGGPSVQYFALALMIGIGVGAYSSVFVAAPLLVAWHMRRVRA